jgi:hypothetical protein
VSFRSLYSRRKRIRRFKIPPFPASDTMAIGINSPLVKTERMTSLELAWREWLENTTPYPKNELIGRHLFIDEFRRYGQALAWLKPGLDYILISKIEALQTRRGEAKRLIEFLKTLSDKYAIRLFARALAYIPDPPLPSGPLLSQRELEDWYGRLGFEIRPLNKNVAEIGYPDLPAD